MGISASEYLKNCRKAQNISLSTVYERTEITNSRLSHIEKGKSSINVLAPEEMRKLAQFYRVPMVEFLLNTGYLTPKDLSDYQKVFDGISLLSDDEIDHVQAEIDFLNRGRGSL